MPKAYRQVQRAPLDVFANRVLGDDVFMCRTHDISTEALRFRRLLEPERAARQVQMEFQLPGTREIIWAHGEIVREPGERSVVVRFLSMAERHRGLIDAYVRQARRNRRRAAKVR